MLTRKAAKLLAGLKDHTYLCLFGMTPVLTGYLTGEGVECIQVELGKDADLIPLPVAIKGLRELADLLEELEENS